MSAQATPPGATPAFGVGSEAANTVADRLRTLADEPMLADRREQLRTLAKALTDPDLAGGWAEVPLHAALGGPLPEEAAGRLATRFSGLRVVLVFVPLAVTWAGVAWAGSLYQRELARNPELGAQSFFRLWLEGFGGAMPSFHVMALVVAGAVMGIILLTVLIARAEARVAHRRRHAHERLTGLLTEASLHLAWSRSPERFDDSLTRAADNLAKLTAEARSAAKATRAAAQKVTAATDAAREAAERTEQSATSVASVTSGLVDAVRHVETTVTTLIDDAAARGDAAAHAVTAAVSGVSQDLTGSVTALRQAVADLVTRTEKQQDELVRQLDEDRDRLGMRLEQLLPDLVDRIASAQTVALDAHLAELRNAIEQLARQQRALADAVEALQRAPALQPRLRPRAPLSRSAGSSASAGAATSKGGRKGGILGWFRSTPP